MSKETYRCHNLSSLSHLKIVGNEASVDGRSRGTNGRIELVSQIVEHLKVFSAFHATATGDDTRGARQLGTLRFGQFLANELNIVGLLNIHSKWFGGGRATRRISCLESRSTYGDELHLVECLDCLQGVSSVNASSEGVRSLHRNNLRDWRNIEQSGYSRNEILCR